jgi:Leucine-rich repeat (LRR) protein
MSLKDGIEHLESLKSLNLSGNHLSSVDDLYKLKNLSQLSRLTLTDHKLSMTNPLCQSNSKYRQEILGILPKLEQIDGEIFNRNVKLLNLDDLLADLNSEKKGN